jgi:hypothetical protein
MQPAANNGLLRLISILILAGTMLAAATPSLHAAWIWFLAPVALLAWLDLSGSAPGVATPKRALQVVPFYAVLFSIAFAFHQFGPPAAARAGHGALASTPPPAKTPSQAQTTAQAKSQAQPRPPQSRLQPRPVPIPPNRPTPPSIRPAKAEPAMQVQLPPIAPRTPGSSVTTLVQPGAAQGSGASAPEAAPASVAPSEGSR